MHLSWLQKKEIKNNIKPLKAKGSDLITREVLKQLLKPVKIKLTNFINKFFGLKICLWKMGDVIAILKPEKSPYVKTDQYAYNFQAYLKRTLRCNLD